MTPMTWGMIIPIIINEGLPLAIKLEEKWRTKKDQPVTPEELAELDELAKRRPAGQMLEALKRANIAPDSEQGKALLGLVGAS